MEGLLDRTEQACAAQHRLVLALDRQQFARELKVQLVLSAQFSQEAHSLLTPSQGYRLDALSGRPRL